MSNRSSLKASHELLEALNRAIAKELKVSIKYMWQHVQVIGVIGQILGRFQKITIERCHRRVQWTLDFCQSTLTDIYPEWLRQHARAYNAWAQAKGRTRLVLAECNNGNRSAILSQDPFFASTHIAKLASGHEVERGNEMVPRPSICTS